MLFLLIDSTNLFNHSLVHEIFICRIKEQLNFFYERLVVNTQKQVSSVCYRTVEVNSVDPVNKQ